MPREKNIQNLKTEKEGILILKSLISSFIVPNKEERMFLYKILDIDYKKYSRSVDGIILKVPHIKEVKTKDDFDLIEIKTTKSKAVKKLPYNVFFGFTENEEDLFRLLDNYKLCIVHTILQDYVLINFEEYESLIQNKRIQYQINFKKEDLGHLKKTQHQIDFKSK